MFVHLCASAGFDIVSTAHEFNARFVLMIQQRRWKRPWHGAYYGSTLYDGHVASSYNNFGIIVVAIGLHQVCTERAALLRRIE